MRKKEKKIHENHLSAIFKDSGSPREYLEKYADFIKEILINLDYQAITRTIELLLGARRQGATIFFVGNGGSAATASHFSQDLGELGRKAGTVLFRSISLTESTSFMTALGNDYGIERIFTGQLDNLFRKGDILVAISVSGNSPNIVECVKLAKRRRGRVIGLVGFDGGKLAKLCDCLIRVDTQKGEYGPVEDMHLIIEHMITSYIMMRDIYSRNKGG